MNWFEKTLIVIWVLEPIIVTARMGKQRSPWTEQDAMGQIIINALLIWGLMTNWGR